MKNIATILILIICISCKAQTTISIDEAATYRKTAEGIPESVQFVKDTQNKLQQFVGTWKGSYDGKQYEITLEKKENYGNYSIKWDKLIGRMLVKDNSGNIIYNSMNKADYDTFFWGDTFQYRTYVMSFVGNYDCLESGDVFIETLPNKPNQMTLYYSQDKDGLITSPSQCPNFSTFISLLPKDKMTLTKQ